MKSLPSLFRITVFPPERLAGWLRRRTTRIAAAVVLAGAVAAGAVLFASGPSRITLANFDLIHDGMTLRELEALLGPAGDYATGPTIPQFEFEESVLSFVREVSKNFGPENRDLATLQKLEWEGDDGFIEVWLDSGIVSRCTFTPTCRAETSTLEFLRWQLERLWNNRVRCPGVSRS
jgi:hypothetical protein